jgi:hypothetical protein
LIITKFGVTILIIINAALMVVMGLPDQPVLFALGYASTGFIGIGFVPFFASSNGL